MFRLDPEADLIPPDLTGPPTEVTLTETLPPAVGPVMAMTAVDTSDTLAGYSVIISLSFFFSLFFAHLLCFMSYFIISICSIQIRRDRHFSRFIGIQIT